MLAGMPLPPDLLSSVSANAHSIEPNLESGANIDCCKLYRDNKQVRTIFHIRNDTCLHTLVRNTSDW